MKVKIPFIFLPIFFLNLFLSSLLCHTTVFYHIFCTSINSSPSSLLLFLFFISLLLFSNFPLPSFLPSFFLLSSSLLPLHSFLSSPSLLLVPLCFPSLSLSSL